MSAISSSIGAGATFPVGYAPERLTLGDLDGDGNVDLAVLRRDDSELSRFNRFASTKPFAFSPPTMQLLRVARVRAVSIIGSGV